MAILFDANLGTVQSSGGSTRTLTTSAAAAAASRVIVLVSYFTTTVGPTGVTIGGTAAAMDKRATNGSDKFDIWSLHVAGGLATSSSIVIAGAIDGGLLAGAVSFTGIATTGAVVTTGAANTTGANWSSGAATNTGQANAVYVGGAGNEDPTATPTSTPTSGTEIHDFYRAVDQQGIATGYKIVATVASDSITGTFSNSASTANTGALAIYAAAAGAAAKAIIFPGRTARNTNLRR